MATNRAMVRTLAAGLGLARADEAELRQNEAFGAIYLSALSGATATDAGARTVPTAC